MSWGQCIHGNHTFCQRECTLLISPPFSGFHSGLCQWGRGNAVAIQAPSVLCEDLNSDHQHKTPVCELDNGCPGAKRQNVQLCSNRGCRNHYGTIATLWDRGMKSGLLLSHFPAPPFPPSFLLFSLWFLLSREGRTRELILSIRMGTAALFAWSAGLPTLKPFTTFPETLGLRACKRY